MQNSLHWPFLYSFWHSFSYSHLGNLGRQCPPSNKQSWLLHFCLHVTLLLRVHSKDTQFLNGSSSGQLYTQPGCLQDGSHFVVSQSLRGHSNLLSHLTPWQKKLHKIYITWVLNKGRLANKGILICHTRVCPERERERGTG